MLFVLLNPANYYDTFDSVEHLYMYGQPQRCEADFKALEKRRFEAMRLLHQGHNQSETARRLNVARQTVSEWRRQYREQGAADSARPGAPDASRSSMPHNANA